MLIIGLTGSIGMGKSTAAARFREHGVAVFDADAEVHRLYAGPLVADMERAFPGSTAEGKVDRARLSAVLVEHPQGFKKLEALVHPQIRAAERRFIQSEHERGASLAVLEVPLLFEAGGSDKVDVRVVVSASPETQRRRVLSRIGMSETKLETIVGRQLPEAEKRQRADFVVDTDGTIENCHRQIDDLVAKLADRQGDSYDRFGATEFLGDWRGDTRDRARHGNDGA